MNTEYEKCVRDIKKYSLLGYQRNLTIADSGNVSCRYKDGILVTRSGSALGEITDRDILYVGMDGKVLAGEEGAVPSKETKMHLHVYKERTDVQCVYHVHPPYSTVYAVRGKEIPFPTSTSRRKIGRAPLVPYADPGSEELAEYVREAIMQDTEKKLNVLLLEKHGIMTFADSVRKSFQLAELLEITAKIALLEHFV